MNLRRTSAALVFVATVATFAVTAVTQSAGASGTAPATAPSSAAPAGAFVPGQVLTHFRSGMSAAAKAAVVRGVGAMNGGTIRDLGVNVLRVPDGAEQHVIDALLRSGKVTFAERDGVVSATATPNDTYWPQQWGPAKINASTAWNSTTGAASTVVAVLDSGVDFTHADLQGRFVPGYDFVNNDSDPTDDYGHGTETAGIVGAASDNAKGIAGMCWSCSIMPVKVLGSTGSGSYGAAASGITWATDHGAKVISMSFGGGASSAEQSAIQYAQSHDVVVVAAAGNNGSTAPFYPAYYPGVLSVAGTQSNDTLYSWSDYGSWVQVAAPGCDYATSRGGGYSSSFCGTSAATPVVAGLAGLARSLAPSATAAQVQSAIESSAVNVGSVVAYGRVDAAATLAVLGGPAPAPAPTTSSSSPTPAPSPTTTAPATTTTTFSGSLTNKFTSRSYSVDSGAGAVQLNLAFNKTSALTLTLLNSSGQVVLKTSGASPVPASAMVAAGSYSLTISGSNRASFTLTATTPTP